MVRWYRLRGRANQLGHFLRTEDHRQSQALFRIGQILFHVSPLQHLDVEEAESANVQNNGVDGKLPLSEQVRVVTPEVIRADSSSRRVNVLRKCSTAFRYE